MYTIGIDFVDEELLSSIPVMLMCILRWTYQLSKVQHLVLDRGFLSEHVRQIKALENMDYLLVSTLYIVLYGMHTYTCN